MMLIAFASKKTASEIGWSAGAQSGLELTAGSCLTLLTAVFMSEPPVQITLCF